MDKVLKQRLIGASILIALAVIFLPMLFDAPDDPAQNRPISLDLPAQPAQDRPGVRRLPLEPDRVRAPAPTEPVPEPVYPEPVYPEVAEIEPDWDEPIDLLEPREIDPEIVRAPEPAPTESREAPAALETPAEATPEPSIAEASEPPVTPAPTPAPRPATPAVEAAAAPSGVADPVWLVQIATFGSRQTADEILERLSRLGHNAFLDPMTRGNTQLYRVRTGPYPGRAEADTAMAQIARTVSGIDQPVVLQDRLPASHGGSAADGSGYVVQVGSFAGRENVDRLLSELSEAGFDPFVIEDRSGARTIWRVRIGPVGSRAAAESRLVELRTLTGQDGILVSHP